MPTQPTAPRRRLLLALVVAGLALWPRLLPGPRQQAPTWDELFWTHAALRFHQALASTHGSRTYIIGQPGVTPLWIWSGQLALHGALAGPAERERLLDLGDRLRQSKYPEGNLAAMRELAEAWRELALGRGTAWATALLCGLLAWLLAGRFGLLPAALAGLRLAWDPYLLAHSRVVALDAILAGLCLLTVTLAMEAARRPGRGGRALLAAGAAAGGLAMLAKLPGGVALGWGGLCLLLVGEGRLRGWGRALGRAALWGALGLAAWAAAWPAMWSVPLKTLGKLRDTLLTYHQAAYDSMFFLGRAGEPPGPLFYPAVLLWRALPSTLLGLGLLGLGLAAWALRAAGSDRCDAPGPATEGHLDRGPDPDRSRAGRLPAPIAAALPYLGFALCYGAALSLADSKFERYLLPALAALNLAVGLAAGLLLQARRTGEGPRPPARSGRFPAAWSQAPSAILALALLLEPLLGRGWREGLAWYNPLAGGAAAAEAALPAGWGEGTEQAAAYLAAQPAAADLTVASEGMVSLLPDFPGRIVRARGQDCATADYVLVYVFDRQLGSPAARAYAAEPPVFVGRVRGRPWLWLYRGGRPCAG